MTGLFRILLASFMVCSLSAPVLADTDYHCLSTCYSAKGTSGNCLNQCTYNIDMTPKAIADQKKKLARDPHNQFAKQFVANGISINQPLPTQNPPEKSFQCITQCIKQGMQYHFCELGCISH